MRCLIPYFSVIAAVGLAKQSIFRLPSPFATVSVDDHRVLATEVVRKTLNPHWNVTVDVCVSCIRCHRLISSLLPRSAFMLMPFLSHQYSE